ACACCYRIWTVLEDCERTAVNLAEKYCDGKGVNKGRLKKVSRAVDRFPHGECYTKRWGAANAAKGAASVIQSAPHGAYSWTAAADVAWAAGLAGALLGEADPGAGQEIPEFADLLRCIVGTPFPPFSITPACLTLTCSVESFERLRASNHVP